MWPPASGSRSINSHPSKTRLKTSIKTGPPPTFGNKTIKRQKRQLEQQHFISISKMMMKDELSRNLKQVFYCYSLIMGNKNGVKNTIKSALWYIRKFNWIAQMDFPLSINVGLMRPSATGMRSVYVAKIIIISASKWETSIGTRSGGNQKAKGRTGRRKWTVEARSCFLAVREI